MARYKGNSHLIPITVVIFFLYSCIASLTPFLSLHVRDLGLNLRETAIVNGAAALLSLLGPPLACTVAERRAKYKTVTVISLALAGMAYTSLLIVPRALRTPREPLAEFDCTTGVNIERCPDWNSCADADISTRNLSTFRLTDCRYQCPSGVVNISYPLHVCFHGDQDNICVVYDPTVDENASVEFDSRFVSWYVDELPGTDASKFRDADPETTPPFLDVCGYRPAAPIVVSRLNFQNVLCRRVPAGCTVRCRLTVRYGREVVKPASCVDIAGDPALTFWAYLGVRAFADACLLATLCLVEAVNAANTNDFQGIYGKMRVFAALAFVIFPPVSGILVDYYSRVADRPDYSPAIFVFDGLTLITCALLIALPFRTGTESRRAVVAEVPVTGKTGFWSPEMAVLVFLAAVLGTQWGCLDTFLPWFYTEIGLSKLFLGLTLTLTFLCSIPFLYISKLMVRNIGKAHLVVFAFLFYGLRFGGLSYVTTPWWTLPFEAMETFTLGVMWIALVAYGQTLVPRGYRMNVPTVLLSLHFGLGRVLGSVLGGFGIEFVGLRHMFRGVAIFSTSLGLLYLLVYHTCLKKSRRTRKRSTPVSENGNWYRMAEQRPNGDAKAHQPIIGDLDE